MLICFAVATFIERIRSPFARAEEAETGPANAGEPPGPLLGEALLEPVAQSSAGQP
jgi:hypothetical protein